jgi:hypothetical protein
VAIPCVGSKNKAPDVSGSPSCGRATLQRRRLPRGRGDRFLYCARVINGSALIDCLSARCYWWGVATLWCRRTCSPGDDMISRLRHKNLDALLPQRLIYAAIGLITEDDGF